MVRTKLVSVAVLQAFVLSSAVAMAQFDVSDFQASQGVRENAVTANGAASVKQNPVRMRLYTQLLAKGKTMEEALEKMKERREAAVLQLETLKADKKSIVIGSPSPSGAETSQKRRIEAMVMEQMRSRGRKAKTPEIPKSVTLIATLTAEWPLETDAQEQLLVWAQGIEEKIKAADLAGVKEAEKLSPEEEELADEAASLQTRFGDEMSQPGQVALVFVAELSPSAREKAMAEAFANAKAQAAELAKAAGVELGPLVGLSGTCQGQTEAGEEHEYYGSSGPWAAMRAMMLRKAGQDRDGKHEEAVSTTPGPITFTCNVTAMFALPK